MFSNVNDQAITLPASDDGGIWCLCLPGRWRQTGCEKMAAWITCLAEYLPPKANMLAVPKNLPARGAPKRKAATHSTSCKSSDPRPGPGRAGA
jgi:hypothetical protein